MVRSCSNISDGTQLLPEVKSKPVHLPVWSAQWWGDVYNTGQISNCRLLTIQPPKDFALAGKELESKVGYGEYISDSVARGLKFETDLSANHISADFKDSRGNVVYSAPTDGSVLECTPFQNGTFGNSFLAWIRN